MNSLPPSAIDNIKKEVAQEIDKVHKKPFIISIMGQTGIGKTSLLIALFNKANIDKKIDSNQVNHVRPATRKPETYSIKGENGHILEVHDLPGIGESNDADINHLDVYRQNFQNSDIVLWALQADNRSMTFDVQALASLLGKLDAPLQEQLVSKMVFVLTKVDTLLPSPWYMAYNKPSVKILPSKETLLLIKQKQDFFQEQLIQPFGSHIVAHTHNDVRFALNEPPFEYDDNNVTYRGLLTSNRVEELSKVRPQWKSVFERLYENYCPIPCSARFRFNISELMLVILNKLSAEAAPSFKNAVDIDRLRYMSLDDARRLCNILIWNMRDSRKIFDLEDGIFPDSRMDSVFYKKIEQQRKGWFWWKK